MSKTKPEYNSKVRGPMGTKKQYKVIEEKPMIVRDYSRGFDARSGVAKNLVRISNKKVVAYFQQIVIENPDDDRPKIIAHALTPGKDKDGKLELTGHYKVGETIMF